MPEIELQRERQISLPTSYKYIVNFAMKHDGIFDFEEYQKYLAAEVFTPAKHGTRAPKLLAQELKWKRTSIDKMLHDHVMLQISDRAFRLNPEIAGILKKTERPKKEFIIGQNHLKLLKLHENGVITSDALKATIHAKSLPETDRQRKMQNGMLKNLAANGYLEKRADGSFALTQKSADLMQANFTANAADLKLLKQQKDGIIQPENLDKKQKGDGEQKARTGEKQERQLKNLTDGGYAVRYGKDLILTPKGKELLKDADKAAKEQSDKLQKGSAFNITAYDGTFAGLAQHDRFSIADVEAQPDSQKLKKRLMLLISRNFIREDGRDAFILSDELKDRLHVLKAEQKYRPIKCDATLLDLAKGAYRIDKADLEAHPQYEMLQKRMKLLLDRGLIRDEFGGYTLTGNLVDMLKEVKSRGSFAVNRFDLAFREISTDHRFTIEMLRAHPRAVSLEKRLDTLMAHEMITEQDGQYVLSDAFLDRLKAAEVLSIDRSLSLDVFTKEEKDMLRDMGIFSQLTEWQIYTYIYGRRRDLMNGDLRRLIAKKVVEYDAVQKVYTPTGLGTIFALQLSGKERYYKSKAKSRPEEIAHDVLVYEAYRDMLRKLQTQGCEIKKIETDREMRSRINSVPMGIAVLEQIPDLRLYFKTPDGKEDYKNIEIDCGYSSATVEKKIAGLAHNGEIHWYANSQKSANRAVKAAVKLGFKVVRDASVPPRTEGLKVAKTLYVSVVEDDLSTHKISFKEGRRFNAFAKQKRST